MQRFRIAFCYTALCLIAFSSVPSLMAQDTRTVTEPKIPPTCATLDAQLTSIFDGKFNTLAPADESKLDTDRIQKAIDSCGKGKAVKLVSHATSNAFLSGPLELHDGVTLQVDKGATLFETLDTVVMQTAPGRCCKPLISATNVSGAGVMGDGVIDGRGGEKLLGKDVTAWDHAGGGLTRLIVCNHADNFTVYRITLKNSANFHIVYGHGDGLTVWALKIDTPQDARNTDGVDPGNNSKNITITHSWISTGDDDVALKAGGDGPTTNVTVAHNHFYYGHGMSIGSETNAGASKIRVTDLSLDGTKHGLRIKSNPGRGGLVHDVLYSDICIRNVTNPIEMDSAYDPADMHFNISPDAKSIPVFTDITLHNVRIQGGGKITFNGYSQADALGMKLDDVQLTDTGGYTYALKNANIQLGPEPANLQLTGGENITVSGKAGKGAVASCSDKFVPYPR